MSNQAEGEQQYVQQVLDLTEQFAQIADVPVVADLAESGALGICGPRGVEMVSPVAS